MPYIYLKYPEAKSVGEILIFFSLNWNPNLLIFKVIFFFKLKRHTKKTLTDEVAEYR